VKEAPEKNIHPSVDDSEKNFACRARSKRGKSEATSSCAKELIAEVCGILDRLYYLPDIFPVAADIPIRTCIFIGYFDRLLLPASRLTHFSDTIFKQKLLDFLVMLISLENVI
jgi:hypothetical protein